MPEIDEAQVSFFGLPWMGFSANHRLRRAEDLALHTYPARRRRGKCGVCVFGALGGLIRTPQPIRHSSSGRCFRIRPMQRR